MSEASSQLAEVSQTNKTGEETHPGAPIIDLRLESSLLLLPPKIRVASSVLAAEKWPEMLHKTEETKKEYGIIISDNGKRLKISKIWEGLSERKEIETAKIINPSFPIPLLSHGIRSLDPRLTDIVLIHTHPMTPEIDHLPTTAMAEGDIDTYIHSRFKIFLALDRGGIHMLRGMRLKQNRDDINPLAICNKASETNEAHSNTVAEFREHVAKALEPFGIQYYFSPNITPLPNEFITFTNAAVERPKTQST